MNIRLRKQAEQIVAHAINAVLPDAAVKKAFLCFSMLSGQM